MSIKSQIHSYICRVSFPQEDIDEYFGKYGTIKDSVIMVEKGTGKPRGFAFVEVRF